MESAAVMNTLEQALERSPAAGGWIAARRAYKRATTRGDALETGHAKSETPNP